MIVGPPLACSQTTDTLWATRNAIGTQTRDTSQTRDAQDAHTDAKEPDDQTTETKVFLALFSFSKILFLLKADGFNIDDRIRGVFIHRRGKLNKIVSCCH